MHMYRIPTRREQNPEEHADRHTAPERLQRPVVVPRPARARPPTVINTMAGAGAVAVVAGKRVDARARTRTRVGDHKH